jgi:hypothetical protein
MKRMERRDTMHLLTLVTEREHGGINDDTCREVHEMFKTTYTNTLKQDKKCQSC